MLGFLTALFRPTATAADRSLSSPQLRSALEAERMRCDRNGSPFAFLTLKQHEAGLSNEQWEGLLRYLNRRLRATDQFGMFSSSRLGILLTSTNRKGAIAVCQYLCEALQWSENRGIEIFVYPFDQEDGDDGYDDGDPTLPLDDLFNQPLPTWKRCLDIGAATMGCVVLAPVFGLTWLLVRTTSSGPVIFAQSREGYAGRIFTMYKFRTMLEGAEAMQAQLRAQSEQDGPAFKIENDPRITWIGRYLRKSCIDELPQLWNVLRGEMSIVGPRPLPVDESIACEPWQRRRLHVTPGLTCFWQAQSGAQNVAFDDWMRLDLQYRNRRSVWGDLKLIFQTALKVVLHRASK